MRGSRYGRAAFERELHKLELTSSGRHRVLFHVAANVGALVAGGELDGDGVEGPLLAAARRLRLPESEIRRTVRDGFRRGAAQPRSAPVTGPGPLTSSGDVRQALAGWWEHVCAQDWSDRRGSTTLKILAGFYRLALGAGKVRLVQSYREIAEAAGVSVGTVSKHEGRWSRYVAVVAKGSRFGAARVESSGGSRTNRSVFQLLTAAGADGNRPEATATARAGMFPASARRWVLRPPQPGGLSDPAVDVWQRRSAAWRLWCLLDPLDVTSTADLAAATGLPRRSVARTLGWLTSEGLVTGSDGDGWAPVDGPAPAALVPYGELRRVRHRRDRERFSAYLAGRAERAADEARRKEALTAA